MTRLPQLTDDQVGPPGLVAAIRQRRGGQLLELDRLLLHSPAFATGWGELMGRVRSLRAGLGWQDNMGRLGLTGQLRLLLDVLRLKLGISGKLLIRMYFLCHSAS